MVSLGAKLLNVLAVLEATVNWVTLSQLIGGSTALNQGSMHPRVRLKMRCANYVVKIQSVIWDAERGSQISCPKVSSYVD